MRRTLRQLWISCRPRQWVKNGFVLLPVIFARHVFEPEAWLRILAACALFCLASSAVYLLNDVADRAQDRIHPLKRRRPIASGALPVPIAVACATVAGVLALLAACRLQHEFGVILATYLAVNVVYGRWLREEVILDVFCIALFFVLRVVAGIFILGVELSYWMLILTALLALFLALNKRRYELVRLAQKAHMHRAVLHRYSLHLIDQMSTAITAAILIIYILFTMDPQQVDKFGSHNLVYSIPFVAYGLFRYQYLVFRRGRGGDPAEIILTDRKMIANVILWVVVCALAIYAGRDWIVS